MKKVVSCVCGIAASIVSATSLSAYTDYSGTMEDFMGINVHTVYWKHRYQANNDKIDLKPAFKWVRNYLRWDAQEPQPDQYKFADDEMFGKIRWLDEYYRRLNADGMNIVVVPIEVPDTTNSFFTDINGWFQGSKWLPAENGDGSEPDHYRERAEFLAQLAARYGPSGNTPEGWLETEDRVQGLDYVRYIEGANEPNQKWRDEFWPDAFYGQWMNAGHDGKGVKRSGSMPIAGVKQGDPNVTHVMCGLVDNGVDLGFLDHTLLSAGRQAYDIINVHSYFKNKYLQPAVEHGVSPEFYILESGLDELQKTIEWRDANSPGTPVWITEFGWDTHLAENGTHSETYAPEPSQANYILRAFPLLKKIGLEKAFLYFDFDAKAGSPQMHMSSGIITKVDNTTRPLTPKLAYYYMATMSHVVGKYAYDGAHIFGEGEPKVYAYSFSKSPTDKVVMIWCRDGSSMVDNGTTISNYVFSAPYMSGCEQIVPSTNEEEGTEGISTQLAVSQGGQAGASVNISQLSETPIFLKLTGSQAIDLNLAPVAKAGKDVEIISSVTTTTLHGSGTDSDGSIASYQWTQLSGPAVTLGSANTADLALSGLNEGDYSFELTVTDNDGATAQDWVSLSVVNRTPYNGTRHQIPGTIEAEHYDEGGQGVAYYDATEGMDTSVKWLRPGDDVDIKNIGNPPTGYYIHSIKPNEWLKYSVTVAESGLYTLDAKIGQFNDTVRRLYIEIDDVALAGTIRPLQTSNWTTFFSNHGESAFHLEAGEHTVKVRFNNTGITFDKFTFTPYDGGDMASGNYFRFNNPFTDWKSLRIFYDVKWGDDIDVLAGGHTHLEFYISNLNLSLVPDWSNVKILICDTSGNSGQISIGDYETNIGENWTSVSIPLADFTSGTSLDLNHVRNLELRSTHAGAFDIGLDEVAFTGGTTPFVWLGDLHSNNPTSNGGMTMEVIPDGGISGLPTYNEPPFVHASADALIRPNLTSYTFDGDAYDIDGTITGYEWEQLSGPTLSSMSGQLTPDLTVHLNTFGTYSFRLYAWDDSGQRGEDDVTLVYEDTGGYISMEHNAFNNQTVTLRYNVSEDAVNVLGEESQPNDTLELHLKRFDLGSSINWNKINVLLKSQSSSVVSVVLGHYISGSIDGDWVKVSIPLSAFPTGPDYKKLTRIRFQSAKAGPFYNLGIDEIQFTGGSKPFIFYGDDNPDADFTPFPSNMSAVFNLTGGAADTAP